MQNNTENQVYAGFFVRLAAYIIDRTGSRKTCTA